MDRAADDRAYPKQKPVNDGSFKATASSNCIKCGRWYPGGIHRHHGKTKGAGGNSTWDNRYDLCPWCHRQAHDHKPGYNLQDLEKARNDCMGWDNLLERITK